MNNYVYITAQVTSLRKDKLRTIQIAKEQCKYNHAYKELFSKMG